MSTNGIGGKTAVVGVGNFEIASQGMATTTLRSVIGGIALDDVLSQREHINMASAAPMSLAGSFTYPVNSTRVSMP